MENLEKKPSNWWKVLLIIILVLAIIFGLYLGLAWVLRKVNGDSSTQSISQSTSTKTSSKIGDQNIVASWDTGCLVPDPDSPWAERHTFVFESNGTATHTRSVGDSCSASLEQDHKEVYNVTIPSSGQINLVPTKDYPDEPTIYDIYQISNNTLLFGHGFCNCSNVGSASGGATAADRFTRLNNFLIYNKK